MGRKKKESISIEIIDDANKVHIEEKKLIETKYKTKKGESTYEFFIGYNPENSTIEKLNILRSRKEIDIAKAIQYIGAVRLLNLLNKALVSAKIKDRKVPLNLSF